MACLLIPELRRQEEVICDFRASLVCKASFRKKKKEEGGGGGREQIRGYLEVDCMFLLAYALAPPRGRFVFTFSQRFLLSIRL